MILQAHWRKPPPNAIKIQIVDAFFFGIVPSWGNGLTNVGPTI